MPRQKFRSLYPVLGLRLSAAREAIGLTQEQVAAEFGYSQDTVSRIELGGRTLDPFELAEFAARYRCELADLLAPATPAELAHLATRPRKWRHD